MEGTINKRIEHLQAYLKMTDIGFSQKAGISTGTLFHIKKGKNVSSKTIDSICDGTGVSREWLLHETGEMLLPGRSQMHPTEGVSWKEEAFTAMKSHNETLMQEVQWLRQLVNSLTGKGQPDFLNTTGIAGVSWQQTLSVA